jgi:hypothetical protein
MSPLTTVFFVSTSETGLTSRHHSTFLGNRKVFGYDPGSSLGTNFCNFPKMQKQKARQGWKTESLSREIAGELGIDALREDYKVEPADSFSTTKPLTLAIQ